EVLMLVASDFLIAKEQHLMLNECRPHLVERLVANLSQVNPRDLGAQCAGNRIHRDIFVAIHRNSPWPRYKTAPDRTTASDAELNELSCRGLLGGRRRAGQRARYPVLVSTSGPCKVAGRVAGAGFEFRYLAGSIRV